MNNITPDEWEELTKELETTYDEDDYKNISSTPERYGLEFVSSLSFNKQPYRFNIRLVLKDKNGIFYTCADAGCSCPTPFERFQSVEELDRVNLATFKQEVLEEVKSTDSFNRPSYEQVHSFLSFLG